MAHAQSAVHAALCSIGGGSSSSSMSTSSRSRSRSSSSSSTTTTTTTSSSSNPLFRARRPEMTVRATPSSPWCRTFRSSPLSLPSRRRRRCPSPSWRSTAPLVSLALPAPSSPSPCTSFSRASTRVSLPSPSASLRVTPPPVRHMRSGLGGGGGAADAAAGNCGGGGSEGGCLPGRGRAGAACAALRDWRLGGGEGRGGGGGRGVESDNEGVFFFPVLDPGAKKRLEKAWNISKAAAVHRAKLPSWLLLQQPLTTRLASSQGLDGAAGITLGSSLLPCMMAAAAADSSTQGQYRGSTFKKASTSRSSRGSGRNLAGSHQLHDALVGGYAVRSSSSSNTTTTTTKSSITTGRSTSRSQSKSSSFSDGGKSSSYGSTVGAVEPRHSLEGVNYREVMPGREATPSSKLSQSSKDMGKTVGKEKKKNKSGSSSSSSSSSSKRSWGQRHDKYLRPFVLDVYVSSKYVTAKIMHRVTSRVVAVASSSSKEMRETLPSRVDVAACRAVGELLAERAKEADVYAVLLELDRGERYEGKLAVVADTMVDNGIMLLL